MNRVATSKEFLERYELEGDDFLHSIVVWDETWVVCYTLETKRQSSQWHHISITFCQKITVIAVKKIMASVF